MQRSKKTALHIKLRYTQQQITQQRLWFQTQVHCYVVVPSPSCYSNRRSMALVAVAEKQNIRDALPKAKLTHHCEKQRRKMTRNGSSTCTTFVHIHGEQTVFWGPWDTVSRFSLRTVLPP